MPDLKVSDVEWLHPMAHPPLSELREFAQCARLMRCQGPATADWWYLHDIDGTAGTAGRIEDYIDTELPALKLRCTPVLSA